MNKVVLLLHQNAKYVVNLLICLNYCSKDGQLRHLKLILNEVPWGQNHEANVSWDMKMKQNIEYTDLIRLTVNRVSMQRCEGRSWKLEMGFTAVNHLGVFTTGVQATVGLDC